ncbi:MAG: hypothetical protein K1X83_01010 [Oligoflexia bacterium]|nr:hypothetical protein [Oligoflexia bacterium]
MRVFGLGTLSLILVLLSVCGQAAAEQGSVGRVVGVSLPRFADARDLRPERWEATADKIIRNKTDVTSRLISVEAPGRLEEAPGVRGEEPRSSEREEAHQKLRDDLWNELIGDNK